VGLLRGDRSAQQRRWRLTLNASGAGNPDLYLQLGTNAPTTGSYLKHSLGEATDTLTLTDTEATPTDYVVGVYLPSGGPVNFTLTSEDHYLTTLPWDPGIADAGMATYTNTSSTGGDYFFKLVTENTDLGMWRIALRVTSGEANLYLRYGALPTITTYDYKSDRTGSDGLVRPFSGGAGQTWYILVKAAAGAQWSLLSGDIFVTDLGAVATNAASSSGLSAIPPEGLRYFKTTIPTETLAWRLWLQNAAGSATWNTNIYVRKSLPPHPESAAYYEQNRTGQALLVPPLPRSGRQRPQLPRGPRQSRRHLPTRLPPADHHGHRLRFHHQQCHPRRIPLSYLSRASAGAAKGLGSGCGRAQRQSRLCPAAKPGAQ